MTRRVGNYADRFADYFEPEARRRGEQYFRAGRVRSLSNEDGVIEAEVIGSAPKPYAIEIHCDDEEADLGPDFFCDCPSANNCKHIWATILAADAEAATGRSLSLSAQLTAIGAEFAKVSGLSIDDALAMLGVRRRSPAPPPPPPPPAWRKLIRTLDRPRVVDSHGSAGRYDVTLWYLLDVERSRFDGAVHLYLYQRQYKKDGSLGPLKGIAFGTLSSMANVPDADRVVLGIMASAGLMGSGSSNYSYGLWNSYDHWSVTPDALRAALPWLMQTGRVLYRTARAAEPLPLARDDGPPWEVALALAHASDSGGRLEFLLCRGSERRPIGDAVLMLEGNPGFCVLDGALADLHTFGCAVSILRDQGGEPLPISKNDVPAVVTELMQLTTAPPLDLPEPWSLTRVRDLAPRGRLELSIDDSEISGQLAFEYGEIVVPSVRAGDVVIDAANRRQLLRNRGHERQLARRLTELGFRTSTWSGQLTVATRLLPEIARVLTGENWNVLADGRVFRRAGAIDIEVTSGIDWFDVDGGVDFGGVRATLPELLKALRAGRGFVQLGDGTLGMLPEEWLARHGHVFELGRVEDDRLRFSRTQVLLLDALLAQAERDGQARFDAGFADLRNKVRAFDGVRELDAPPSFCGALRGYQRHGLGWMHLLDKFGWGGCLADDMGLGKTVQVLAWLADKGSGVRGQGSEPRPSGSVDDRLAQDSGLRTQDSGPKRPSLAVVPKSVVFNWLDEARKFTPDLKVMAYHGTTRKADLPRLYEYDLIVTTYQTLRIDIAEFAKREFEYVILDEAQAVKNAKAQSSKAVRLLKARRRLALTGTPVENRLADLWSLFEFLNPGMLGAVTAFQTAFAGNGNAAAGESLETLRRAVRPFLLRRTKEAVAPELPKKTEETLHVEMTAAQSKRYNELRDYYRAVVLGAVDQIGINRAKIHVLEALLRLRQAACHPKLLDQKVAAGESGKTEALLPLLTEVIDGGHKALVFSQFTSFLAIIRSLLDEQKFPYEYLDGQTRDRKGRVERFQTDPNCKLFLISLKAGGLGLNLTAADYVFILDPWWNPAAEAQAIDRAHRIGQDKKVIAYRLIARGTVEEKILDLQSCKRDLAASIITEANSLISELTREDLEVLLS